MAVGGKRLDTPALDYGSRAFAKWLWGELEWLTSSHGKALW